jgi:zinc transporter
MTASTIDDGGLICGFRLAPLERLDNASPSGGNGAAAARPFWLHFNLADSRARRWVQEESGLESQVVEALLETDPRIHLELAESGIVAVLADLHHDFDRDPEGFGKIRLHADEHGIITVRSQPLQTADRLRRELQHELVRPDSAGQLLHALLQRLGETFGTVVTRIADEVDDVEDEILAGRFREHGKVLGRVRRNLARLRRHANANRLALGPLRGHLPLWLEPERDELRDALGRLEMVAQDLELVQERTRLLQEEIAARLNETTNRNLAVLSTVTTALLPITLITGIFGMNVGGLPGVNHPKGFRWVMLSMLATVVISLVSLLRRRER